MIRLRKLLGIVLSILVVLVNYSSPVKQYNAIPDEIVLNNGQTRQINFGIPVRYSLAGTEERLHVTTGRQILGTATGAKVTSTNQNEAYISIYPLGFLPARRIKIVTIDEEQVMLGGQSIGVIMKLNGVLIVGFSDLLLGDGSSFSPAMSAGVKSGDLIKAANGELVENIGELSRVVEECGGQSIELEVLRNGRRELLMIKPELDKQDNRYHIGIWARDGSSGIGTLTYIDPDSMTFGALGHPITDVDTGDILPVGKGEIYPSAIQCIFKGIAGQPGELKGEFVTMSGPIARVVRNTRCGLFGTISPDLDLSDYEMIPVGRSQEVVTGKAYIYTMIDSEGAKLYECEITKINSLDQDSSKNMVLKITDEELLEKTGGIVQGMSGSPIIQNGKLIGAVTHVLINDPASGHGIFIENMINNSQS